MDILFRSQRFPLTVSFTAAGEGGGGGEDSHMKGTGMFVVSPRDVNYGFWSYLGFSGQNVNILSRKGLV